MNMQDLVDIRNGTASREIFVNDRLGEFPGEFFVFFYHGARRLREI